MIISSAYHNHFRCLTKGDYKLLNDLQCESGHNFRRRSQNGAGSTYKLSGSTNSLYSSSPCLLCISSKISLHNTSLWKHPVVIMRRLLVREGHGDTCFQALASVADEVCGCTHISYGPPSALWSLLCTIGGKQRLNRRLTSHIIKKSENGSWRMQCASVVYLNGVMWKRWSLVEKTKTAPLFHFLHTCIVAFVVSLQPSVEYSSRVPVCLLQSLTVNASYSAVCS